jgi:hypothetical protein
MAGCADGVFRAIKFPTFKGTPVVIPHFPVEIGDAPEKSSIEEDEEVKPPAPKEAPRKIRDKVVRRLTAAVPSIRACVKDHPLEGKKKSKPATVSITFSLNPLGHTTGAEVLGKEHSTDYVAGCVAGVLAFTEFPAQGADSLAFSRVKLPQL